MEKISREELLQQYDRFIDQIRTEVKDLYWLYNFFFVVDSALLGAVFLKKIEAAYIYAAAPIGILLSVYWFVVIRKQNGWRNEWVRKIQHLEHLLGYTDPSVQMWKLKVSEERTVQKLIFGRYGLWKWLIVLPLGFIIIWLRVLF
jgi:hypothetical protein